MKYKRATILWVNAYTALVEHQSDETDEAGKHIQTHSFHRVIRPRLFAFLYRGAYNEVIVKPMALRPWVAEVVQNWRKLNR